MGGAATLQAALRYMLFAVLGSMLYLLGTAMIYGAYGTLDISMLAGRVRPDRSPWIAASLMTLGLLAKTALFPLHLWLPPAHAGAPAAGSAVLSALVVKGSFFVIVRIWFDAMPALREPPAMQLLAGLGSAAILFGSVLALAPAEAQAAHRLFDGRADRLPVLHVPACHPAVAREHLVQALPGPADGCNSVHTPSRRLPCSWLPD